MGLRLSSLDVGPIVWFRAGAMEGGHSVPTRPLQTSGKDVGYRRRLFLPPY